MILTWQGVIEVFALCCQTGKRERRGSDRAADQHRARRITVRRGNVEGCADRPVDYPDQHTVSRTAVRRENVSGVDRIGQEITSSLPYARQT